jgi:DNA-binding FadR family transcriptional regulator
MVRPSKQSSEFLSTFLQYLANMQLNDCNRLPALTKLSQELSASVASLREQLEVARALGFVEVKPKTGIRRVDYSFTPAVTQSLHYAIACDPDYFQAYADMRNHIEAAYWFEAVSQLSVEDHEHLRGLIQRAQEKLDGNPVQIPHGEHRDLHLSIYRRLNNPFVLGLLEAYWDVYESIGLNVYTDFTYLQQVWAYHAKMVEAICTGHYAVGYQTLIDHLDLLYQRSKPLSRQMFE